MANEGEKAAPILTGTNGLVPSPKGTKVINGLPLSQKEAKVAVFISLWVRTECTLEKKEDLRCIAGLEPGTMATLVFMH